MSGKIRLRREGTKALHDAYMLSGKGRARGRQTDHLLTEAGAAAASRSQKRTCLNVHV